MATRFHGRSPMWASEVRPQAHTPTPVRRPAAGHLPPPAYGTPGVWRAEGTLFWPRNGQAVPPVDRSQAGGHSRTPSRPATKREPYRRFEENARYGQQRVRDGRCGGDHGPSLPIPKVYTCPGCQQEIPVGTGHLVVVPVGAADLRRHWHRPCWENRKNRMPLDAEPIRPARGPVGSAQPAPASHKARSVALSPIRPATRLGPGPPRDR